MTTHDADAVWKDLVALSAEALRMTETEAGRFAANPVARLVGLLPFLAGCEEAERTALAHLATWVVANRGGARKVFDHKPADDRDPLARLAPIADFRGGDRRVIEAGMRRLALCMVAGYEVDREKDLASGEYNPLNAGTWKAAERLAALGALEEKAMAEAATLREPAARYTAGDAGVDAILPVETALRGFWQS